jgi:hypothetical protein
MSLSEELIDGMLKPDGTLELHEKPTLRPGRVTVVLRQGADAQSLRPLDNTFFQLMEEIWAGQRARGHVPRSEEEVEAQRRRWRQESQDEIDEAIKLQEESRRLRQHAESGKDLP